MTKHNFACEYSMSFHKVDINDVNLLNEFKCEYDAIREFIQNKSVHSKDDVSYILVDDENNRIMGFCAICCTGITITDINPYNKKPYLTSIPTIEIDYFAVDEEYRGIKYDETSTQYETLSQSFLIYMIDVIKNISIENVGATHICLYSVPKAKSFYKRCGFEEFETYMNRDEVPFLDGCIPMFYVIEK